MVYSLSHTLANGVYYTTAYGCAQVWGGAIFRSLCAPRVGKGRGRVVLPRAVSPAPALLPGWDGARGQMRTRCGILPLSSSDRTRTLLSVACSIYIT